MSDKKYQWSKMSPDRSEQVVVRSDDVDEWYQLIEDARGVLPTVGFPNDSGATATPIEKTQEESPMCGIHKIPMTLKPAGVSKVGRPYPAFYSCGQRNPDGSYCNFKLK